MNKICSNPNCHLVGVEQNIENFYFRNDVNKYRNQCKMCCNKKSNKYYHENKKELLPKAKIYRNINKNKITEQKKIYQISHKEDKRNYDKNYYQNNKEQIKNRNYTYTKNKRKTNTIFQIKCNISHSINEALKRNGSFKKRVSCLKYLPYTIQELKNHLEKQFEPWMNWSNQGQYTLKTWNDNNSSTWTWQIDHIIPHSTFKYISMEDENFKKCWALNNLRPLSSKQNLIDGNKR